MRQMKGGGIPEGGGEEKCNARKVRLTPTMPFREGRGDGGKRGGGKGVGGTKVGRRRAAAWR